MSALVSAMARIWSGGFLEDERALELALPLGVGRKAWPGCDSRAAWMRQQLAATSRTALSVCVLRLGPARAAQRVERRTRLARARHIC